MKLKSLKVVISKIWPYQINDLLEVYRNTCTLQILVICRIVDELRNFIKPHLQISSKTNQAQTNYHKNYYKTKP